MIYKGKIKTIGEKINVQGKFDMQTIILQKDTMILGEKDRIKTIKENLAISFYNEKIQKLEGFKVNDYVEIEFNIRCKKVNNIFFNNVYGINCSFIKNQFDRNPENENYIGDDYNIYDEGNISAEEGSPFTGDDLIDNENYYEEVNNDEYDPLKW